jgi:hypothetical protein
MSHLFNFQLTKGVPSTYTTSKGADEWLRNAKQEPMPDELIINGHRYIKVD